MAEIGRRDFMRRTAAAAALGAAGTGATGASAAQGSTEGVREMAEQHREFHFSPSVNHRAWMDETRPRMAYDGGDVVAWQNALREEVRRLLGAQPAEKAPLNPVSLWKRDTPLGSIEKVVFTAEPYSDVPAYLCLPAEGEPPYPLMICMQGHSTGMHLSINVAQDDEITPIQAPGDRDFGIGCMQRGFAALCIEQRSFGERGERVQEHRSKDTCHDAAMHALMLGRTLAGERVYDIERSIDYLETRPEIDPKRIGVLGQSGGGTITLYSSALVPRLAFAMPSCSFCTFRDSIMSIYHCSDNYIPGMFGVCDMQHILGLFAPRPLVIVAGLTDPIFPIDAARAAFAELQQIYAAAGAPDQCRLVVGGEGHRFYADDAWPVMLELLERT